MKAEDKSKIADLVSELEKLKSRSPEESKFKDWRDKSEKKLEELFGKSSPEAARFHGVRFFDFSKRAGVPKDAPLGEEERARFLQALEEAKRLLLRFRDS